MKTNKTCVQDSRQHYELSDTQQCSVSPALSPSKSSVCVGFALNLPTRVWRPNPIIPALFHSSGSDVTDQCICVSAYRPLSAFKSKHKKSTKSLKLVRPLVLRISLISYTLARQLTLALSPNCQYLSTDNALLVVGKKCTSNDTSCSKMSVTSVLNADSCRYTDAFVSRTVRPLGPPCSGQVRRVNGLRKWSVS